MRTLTRHTLLASLLAVVVLAAPQSSTHADSGSVSISNFAFVPSSLSVAVGTTITWTNNDAAGHTVTADDGSFSSPTLGQNGQYSVAFSQSGTYPYHCAIHPYMHGSIVVGSGGNPSPTPAPTLPPQPTSTSPPLPSATPAPTNTPVLSATATAVPPSPTSAPAPTQAPTSTPIPAATAVPTPTVAPTAAPTSSPGRFAIRISGRLVHGRRSSLKVDVLNRRNGAGVKGAAVKLVGRSAGIAHAIKATSNGKGHAKLGPILAPRAGQATLTVTRSGFVKATRTVRIS